MAEIEAAKKRFGADSLKVDSETKFTLFVPPKDPQTFPYDLKTLNVKFTVPDDYPASILTCQVQNEDLPESLRASIKKRVEDRMSIGYKGKEMIAGMFLFMQVNLEKLMIDNTINRAYQLANRGVEVFAFANQDEKKEEKREEVKPKENLVALAPHQKLEKGSFPLPP